MERQCLPVITTHRILRISPDYDSISHSEITCTVKAVKPCFLQGLWGVPKDNLIKLLRLDIEILRNAITSCDSTELFSKYCIDCYKSEQIRANEKKMYKFTSINKTDEVLDVLCTKSFYLFILFAVAEDNGNNDSSVVAMASVIRFAEGIENKKTDLFSEFVKLSSGRIGKLKEIYSSTAEVTDNNGNRSDLCTVCYDKPVSTVYLPCRHSCVCKDCFLKCERCPICRGPSLCYFQLPITDKN